MGIIPLREREAFINRDRYDFREYKKLTDEQLERRMLKLPVKPPVFYKLTHLQKVCFIIGAETGRFCFFNALGTGKSLLAFALIRYFRKLGKIKHALFLVPNRINKFELSYELQKHCPKSSFLILQGSTADKLKALETSEHLFVFETYAGLSRLVCDKEPNKKNENKLKPNPKKVEWLSKHFRAIVADESVALGNHLALPFRICRKMSKPDDILFELTGTPFNRDPVLLWSQLFLVDQGFTLGETLGLYRSVFCNESINFFTGHIEYKFAKKKKTLLNDFIANRSISFPADEGSLPDTTTIIKPFKLDADAIQYYDRFKQQLIAARGNFQETKNSFIRLRQISSGFVGYDDDETGERAKFEFPANPKFDLLLSLLETVQEEYKSIVFFDFTFSGEKIHQALNKAKIGSVLLYGKTRDVDKERQSFMQDKKKRVLLLQNRFGVGLNVQIAKYSYFYESPVSAITRKQCEGRVVRQHSLHKAVFLYDLVMKNGVDEQILAYHAEGGDLFEAIIRREIKL